jgi:hypothetical protein
MTGSCAPSSTRRVTAISHVFASVVGRSGEGGKGDFYGALKWWGPQCSPYYLVMQRGSPRDSLRHRKECPPPPKCHRHHPSPRSPLVIAPAPSPVPSSSLARGPHSRSPLTPVRHCPCCWRPLSSPPYRSPPSDPSCLPLLIDRGSPSPCMLGHLQDHSCC